MTEHYLGHLSVEDPFYSYLRGEIAPQMGSVLPNARYRVFQFSDSRDVYLYEEIHTHARLVGKFYQSSDPGHARWKGETEFKNLIHLRDLGFHSPPHYVVRPYGFNPFIENVLVVEHLQGESLSHLIDRAMHRGKGDRLFRKLSALAYFLATLHNRTAGEGTVDFEESRQYLTQLVGTLADRWGMGPEISDRLHHLGWKWHGKSAMWEDRPVLVHGDMTPANVLFGRDLDVMVIDLERMKWADRVFDLGRLCGELKHHFFRTTGNPRTAEPFIGHFLWEYSCHFPDRESAFHAVTRRLPFYMGTTLLRIARNAWIDSDYRWRLVREAIATLKG